MDMLKSKYRRTVGSEPADDDKLIVFKETAIDVGPDGVGRYGIEGRPAAKSVFQFPVLLVCMGSKPKLTLPVGEKASLYCVASQGNSGPVKTSFYGDDFGARGRESIGFENDDSFVYYKYYDLSCRLAKDPQDPTLPEYEVTARSMPGMYQRAFSHTERICRLGDAIAHEMAEHGYRLGLIKV